MSQNDLRIFTLAVEVNPNTSQGFRRNTEERRPLEDVCLGSTYPRTRKQVCEVLSRDGPTGHPTVSNIK